MEMGRSTDDPMTSQSIEGKHVPGFEMLDAKDHLQNLIQKKCQC